MVTACRITCTSRRSSRRWKRTWPCAKCCIDLQREFGQKNLHVNDESGYFDSGDLEPLLKMRGIIEEAMNNPELILRLTRWATTGDRVEPPDEEELAGRLN